MSCCGPKTTIAVSAGQRTGAPRNDSLPVAIIGGGPVGLAAAAELDARSLPFVVLEAGPAVASSVRAWSHVPFFSPWSYVTNRAAVALLAEHHPAGYPEPELHLLLSRNSLRVLEVDVQSRERLHGRSSLTPIRLLGAGARVALALLIVPFRAIDGSAND